MTQHPLGNLGTDPDAPPADGSVPSGISAAATGPSIVDTILNLDDLMSADVRRAEKTARFYTRPDLEADIEQLNGRYDAVTDAHGRPLVDPDASVEDTETPAALRAQILATQKAYGASAVSVRVSQMSEDDWQAFRTAHKADLDEAANLLDTKPAVFEDLIVKSRARLVSPQTGAQGEPFTTAQVKAFRKKFGHPAFGEIAIAAWQVNASSGVAIPKSLLSSDGPRPS